MRAGLLQSAALLLGVGSFALAINASHIGCGSPVVTMAVSVADGSLVSLEDAGAVANEAAASMTMDARVGGTLPDAAWRRVNVAAQCPLFEALLPPDPLPSRRWSSCGIGCFVGDVWPAPATDRDALVVGSGGAYMRGETYIYLSNGAQPQRVVITRMSDGSTVAAARIDSVNYECAFSGYGTDAPLLFAVFQEDAGLLFGRASTDAGAHVQWQSQWIRNGPTVFVARFMFDDGHGVASNGGRIDWLPSTSADAFTVLDNSISPVDSISGRSHLLVWNKNDGKHGWLMAFVGDGGAPSTLIAAPDGTWINEGRVTDDRVVWLTVSGPQASQFVYTSARIDWMRYMSTPGQLVTQIQPAGPNIPAATALYHLAAGDDYAATIGCDANINQDQRMCHVYVVELSTGKLWAVPQRPGGNSFRSILAIGPKEIVLAEQDAMPISIQSYFKRIVRISIAHLDDLVASW
jgi:hypothetical protein